MAAFPPWTGYNFVSTLHHDVPPSLDPKQQSLPFPFVVCITGASRGIGAEIAKAFAQAGATGLILTARMDSAVQKTREACQAVAKSPSLNISTLGADAASLESAQRIAEVIKDEHGRLDVLINNAGIMCTHPSAFANLHEMADTEFQDVMNVNYIGRTHLIKYLIPTLLSSPNGARTVINITSFSSHLTSGTPIPFNISELATNRLTECLAEMYADEGLMVHAVHPGMVTTTMPPGMPEHFKAACNDDSGLCGAFLVWLVKERKEWLSGRYLSANWDTAELEMKKQEVIGQDLLKMRMAV